MFNRNRRKMIIVLLLFAVAVMLFRLAYAAVLSPISVWLMGIAIVLVLVGLTVFALYFRE